MALHNVVSARKSYCPETLVAQQTPVWKTDASCHGNVPPSVRRPVRPFVSPPVHPSTFSGLFSICFEISIWSLIYIFSRWHMSSFTAKSISNLIFCNDGLVHQDKFFKFSTEVGRCMPVDIISISCKSHIFGVLAIIFARFGFFEVFRAFVLHVLRLVTWYIHQVGSVEFHSSRDTLTYFTAKNRSN